MQRIPFSTSKRAMMAEIAQQVDHKDLTEMGQI